jgi:hypothetical protein
MAGVILLAITLSLTTLGIARAQGKIAASMSDWARGFVGMQMIVLV